MFEFTLDGNGLAAIIAAMAALVAAVGTYMNGRKIAQVHDLTNSMSVKLNEKTAQVSRQEGFEAGQANPKGPDRGKRARKAKTATP